jgi:putative FmdB family regulatory protein
VEALNPATLIETMPLYEYECNDCEHRFERIQKFSDPLVSTCPVCGGEVRKLLSSPAIQFKGTGWYVTDYAKKPSGDQPSGAAGDAKDGGEQDGASKEAKGKDAASASKDASSSTSKTESSASKTKSTSGSSAAR